MIALVIPALFIDDDRRGIQDRLTATQDDGDGRR